jgi:toxin ParE1/3/4
MENKSLPDYGNGARRGANMANFILAPDVEEELTAIAEYITEHDPDAADRFIEAAYETFTKLANQPGMGRTRRFRASRLKNLRSFRVSGFDDYLIFYSPSAEGIEVYHVFHGARNLERLFRE